MLSGEVSAPGLKLTGIKCIAFYSHLEEDGVDAILLQVVELADEHCLHAVATKVLELSVYGLYPCATEFSLGILSHCCCCNEEQQN